MYKTNIVIIDSGYTAQSEKDNKVYSGIALSMQNNKLIINNDYSDLCGHGSSIVEIIYKMNNNVNIYMLRILNENYECDVTIMIEALEWIYNNVDCDLINMSFGVAYLTNNEEKRLINICRKINEKGTVIVAAHMNEGAMAYPAVLKDVIGVDMVSYLPTIESYIYSENEYVNIIGKKGMYKGIWGMFGHEIVSGTSYVTACITGIISRLITRQIKGIHKVKEKLKEEAYSVAKTVKRNPNILNNNKIEIKENTKMMLFPFNKELHGLVEHSSLLNGQIIKITDTKYGSAGKTVKKVLPHYEGDLAENIIEDICNIQTLDNIDMVVLGHTEELSLASNIDYIKKIIKLCSENNVMLYSLSDIIDLVNDKNINIFVPKVTQDDIPNERYDKLWCINAPVLGIFGTSSCQGKNTLQLKMRELFLKNNYTVAQLGTEPTGLLYGFDYIFPMGYMATTTKLTAQDMVMILNEIMHKLDQKNKDIIIVGGQSGCINYELLNFKYCNIPQAAFLSGTNPDAVILCVNPHDDYNYVKKTIHFIESYNPNTNVVGLVMFPLQKKILFNGNIVRSVKLSEEERESISCMYQKHNRKIYFLDKEENIVELYKLVIDYFTNS